MKNLTCFFIALLFATVSLSAQGPITEGSFVFELTQLETDNPQMSQVFAGATITVDVKDQVYRSLTSMMGQQVNVETYNDANTSANYIYLNIMGNKVATQMPNEEFTTKWQESNENSIITYDTDDTKEIAGFKCYAAKVETLKDDGSIEETQLYLTDEITLPNHLAGHFPEKLEGYPLEYTSFQEGATITFTLKSYKTEVESELTTERDDYKLLPYDEFMNTIGKKMGL